ncbi:MAG: SulP family inorganic anion transporter [Lachnospiraceae bacterium]|nr:SulP family inorganic anion transporter [Lachnospiraceae bacterium]
MEKKEKLKPKLFSVMKTYTKQQFVKDLIAGIIVAIIALPLSIALALASGVGPEEGLFTAIVAGFIISFLGGSRVQIAGPTAAFATIVAGIALDPTKGTSGLMLATIMAGILLILFGLLKLGSLIQYIPTTITTGFTFGIAVTIIIGQVKDFLGLTYTSSGIETIDKVKDIAGNIGTINWYALLIGGVSLLILILWPKKWSIVPASLIAVIVGSVLVAVFDLPVATIGYMENHKTIHYEIKAHFPTFRLPENISFDMIRQLLPDAFTIAVLAAIESLLSCVVSDGMIGSKHRSNMELVAQGVGNTASAFFGGIPATGAIARTAANVKNGGRTPIAGMVHAVVLLLIMIFLMPYAALIPMPTIAAILFQVAYNMSGWRTVAHHCKASPKSDVLVLMLTLVLTVVFDLVVAIAIGLVLAALLFMKRMADVTDVHGWIYDNDLDEETDQDNINLKQVPKNTRVFEINGPMFFAASEKFMAVASETDEDILIIRMRSVPAVDATGLLALEKIIDKCEKNHVQIIFSHVNEQPMKVFTKAGIVKRVGEENFCAHIDAALERAIKLSDS